MDIKIVEMNIKLVQLDIKIEHINFVHDHFFYFQQINIGHMAAALGPLACASRSAAPEPVLAAALGPEMSLT